MKYVTYAKEIFCRRVMRCHAWHPSSPCESFRDTYVLPASSEITNLIDRDLKDILSIPGIVLFERWDCSVLNHTRDTHNILGKSPGMKVCANFCKNYDIFESIFAPFGSFYFFDRA